MPTYEYECSKCGKTHEVFQSITAEPLTDCPHCSGRKSLKRMIGMGAGFIFKGSGFYQTDYRSTSYQKSAQKDKPQSSCSTPESCQTAGKCTDNSPAS